jgi:hypothetical protein
MGELRLPFLNRERIMLLKLTLPKDKVIWAAAHPYSREYIHSDSGVGYEKKPIIVTVKNQPVEVELDDYPKWAQEMVMTSLRKGELINIGDPVKVETVEKVETQTTVNEVEVTQAEEPKASKTTKKTGKKKTTKKASKD